MRFLNRPFATSAADFFVFALGLCTSFSVTFIGDFPIAEIILTPLVLVLVALRGRRANRPGLKIILVLMFLWLMGQVVSDSIGERPRSTGCAATPQSFSSPSILWHLRS